MEKIKPSELETIVRTVVLEGGLPVMVWGSAGIGKSEIINSVAKASEYNMLDLRLNYYEESDMLGIPMKTENGIEFIKQSAFPRNGKGVWFLDELTHAKTSIQGLAFQLINDKKIDSYTIPEGWRHFIGASNMAVDRSISNPMPSGLANRFVGGHYQLVPDLDDWSIWASANGIDGRIISFLRYMQKTTGKEWLYRKDGAEAFLSPRIWAKGINFAMKHEGEIRGHMIRGMIGEENGMEYLGYLKRVERLPQIETILGGDYTWFKNVKNDTSLVWLFLSGVSTYIFNSKSKAKDVDRAIDCINKNLSTEYLVYLIKILKKRDDIKQTLTESKSLRALASSIKELIEGEF